MRAKNIFPIIVIAVLAGAAGWFARQQWPSAAPASTVAAGRKIKFYQSAMHPWITSDKPGKCTVCGMDLVPVYEGDAGFALDAGLITLNSNSVSVLNVQTAEVKRRALERALRVAGTIDDSDTQHRRLSAYVDGRIEKLFVNYVGAEVVAGQPLASIYSPMLLSAEREYVTLLRQDHSSLTGAAEAEHRRLIEAASQRLIRLGLVPSQISRLPQKSENESSSEILAPMAGTVVAREVYAGQYVKEGDRLFELADFATMWFVFDAYERDLAWIQPGQAVEVTTPARPGKVYPAAITFIDPNLNEATRSAKVRVEIPNPLIEENGVQRRELFHKLYAQAVVKVVASDALTVPRGAVLSPGAQPIVYVEKGGGAYEQRSVRLGRAGDEFWEVLAGLDEGEHVVTSGNLLIDAQAQINQTVQAAVSKSTLPANTNTPAPTQSETTNHFPALPSLDDAQRIALKDFLSVADALATALAQDNLASFHQHTPDLRAALPALVKAFAGLPAWKVLAQSIQDAGELSSAPDLAAARRTFFPFSSATVAFAKALRATRKEFASLKIYQCPMTNRAIPGAPKTGFWLQAEGPLRNPFLGAEMPDCGTEVKP